MKKSETKRTYWSEKLGEWKASGLSGAEFCRREQLDIHNFYRWHRVLKTQNQITAKPKPRLVPVALEQDSISSYCSLVFQGIEFKLEDEHGIEIALRVIERLRAAQ